MPARQNLEIMTFRYFKTLAFDKFLKILQHYLMFLFLESIIVITTPPLYHYLTLPPNIHLSPGSS